MNEETKASPIEEACGPYHDFWLLRESEYPYEEYIEFAARKDAPVRIAEDTLRYFMDALTWIPTLNPAYHNAPPCAGLCWYGPTIIDETGGARFTQICEAWANLLRYGPERLILTAGSSCITQEDGTVTDCGAYQFWVDRDAIIADLERLAEFGRQAATGEFYILHMGI